MRVAATSVWTAFFCSVAKAAASAVAAWAMTAGSSVAVDGASVGVGEQAAANSRTHSAKGKQLDLDMGSPY